MSSYEGPPAEESFRSSSTAAVIPAEEVEEDDNVTSQPHHHHHHDDENQLVPASSPPPPTFPHIINLNVGGIEFTTTLTTLRRYPDSYLATMFSGRHDLQKMMMVMAVEGPSEGKGGGGGGHNTTTTSHRRSTSCYFIDRDGKHFEHILNFLRSGTVITLPKDDSSKEALAIEADYYGLDGLVNDIRRPKLDIAGCLPGETHRHWDDEAKIRQGFVDGTASSRVLPFNGLIPLFPSEDDEDWRAHEISLPLMFDADGAQKYKKCGTVFFDNIRTSSSSLGGQNIPATVKSLEEFETNFNKEFPNILHRLKPVLQDENIIVAGGAVLRCLTASEGVRTADWWRERSGYDREGISDIDLFLYGCTREDANRISRRVFDALIRDTEPWVVVRARGVVNIHRYVMIDRWQTVETKVQIVLRLYDSPAEVLVGFDIDCCCCAYTGRGIWVSPRWITSLQYGINVLNALHAWPNKASFEFRLAKYAFRGFSVLVPGVDMSRIDIVRLNRSEIKDLKGLARLIKVELEMDSARPFKLREYANERDEGAEWDEDLERFWIHRSQPRTPQHIQSLRYENARTVSDDIRRLVRMNQGYDDYVPSRLIVPREYTGYIGSTFLWTTQIQRVPDSLECHERAWAEIEDTGPNHPHRDHIEQRLIDAWDVEKRSRETLNAQMDKMDLDNIYYNHAYHQI